VRSEGVVPRHRHRSALRDFERLLGQARTGDRDAEGRVLDRYRRLLLRAAERALPQDLRAKGGASDLVQQTFLEAHRDFARFGGRTSEELLAWLRCLLQNNFANFVRYYRRRLRRQVARERPLPSETRPPGPGEERPLRVPPTPCDDAIRGEAAERCQHAVNQLRGVRREVVRLRYVDRLSNAEIGARLGVSPEAARKILVRALREVGAGMSAND
jgi:RNA polymerase sigma-70 factor (ECF subfamily)